MVLVQLLKMFLLLLVVLIPFIQFLLALCLQACKESVHCFWLLLSWLERLRVLLHLILALVLNGCCNRYWHWVRLSRDILNNGRHWLWHRAWNVHHWLWHRIWLSRDEDWLLCGHYFSYWFDWLTDFWLRSLLVCLIPIFLSGFFDFIPLVLDWFRLLFHLRLCLRCRFLDFLF